MITNELRTLQTYVKYHVFFIKIFNKYLNRYEYIFLNILEIKIKHKFDVVNIEKTRIYTSFYF